MDDQNVSSEPVAEAPSLVSVEPVPEPVDVAPEISLAPVADPSVSPTSEESSVEPTTSEVTEPTQSISSLSAPASLTSDTSQSSSPAQQDQTGFIRALLAKAQAKIQFNKQKKLDKLIQLAQKKQIITNDDVQKILRVSDATATRYLVKLVGQGRLARAGNPRDAKYQFVR